MTAKLALTLAAAALIALAAWTLRPAPQTIQLTNATARPLPDGALLIALTMNNPGPPDRLTAATSPDGGQLALIGTTADALAIPAGSTPALAADGAHLVLTGLPGPAAEGRLIPIALSFASAPDATTRARLNATADPHAGHAVTAKADPPPKITLDVTEDADGWHIEATTKNFRFDRDAADGPHVPGAGHGHLYLNGLKLQRLYQPTARIGALPSGTHEVRVTLNANDHRPYGVEATATITAR